MHMNGRLGSFVRCHNLSFIPALSRQLFSVDMGLLSLHEWYLFPVPNRQLLIDTVARRLSLAISPLNAAAARSFWTSIRIAIVSRLPGAKAT